MTDTNEEKTMDTARDLSEMIERLKSNPEIVTSVASALGLGAPPLQSEPNVGDSSSSSTPLPEMLSAIAPLLSHSSEKNGGDHRTALLCALRPYLSPERQEIIDYIMKFSKMGDLIKKLK